MLDNLKPIYTSNNAIKENLGIKHAVHRLDWWDFLEKYPLTIKNNKKEYKITIDIKKYLEYQKIYFIYPHLLVKNIFGKPVEKIKRDKPEYAFKASHPHLGYGFLGFGLQRSCCEGAIISLRTLDLWSLKDKFYSEDFFIKEENIFIHSCQYKDKQIFEQKIYEAIENFKQKIKININHKKSQIMKNYSMSLYSENLCKKYGEK